MTENKSDTLLRHLTRELWQTETSALRHGRREARRLGDTPPGRALGATAAHAELALGALRDLASRERLVVSGAGVAVGRLFSELRDTLVDKLIARERSYRGTLLGLRHGVDVVRAICEAAPRAGHHEFADYCGRWLDARLPLIAAVERELRWFAEHPEKALQPARAKL